MPFSHSPTTSHAKHSVRPSNMQPSCALLVALLALHAAPPVDARFTYRASVPNSAEVTGFKMIGHIADTAGGGPRNAFGAAFEAAKLQWTPELCALDSDGDGQTDGQELDDPCCQWVETTNEIVLWTTGVSHPGDASLTADASLWAGIDCSASSTTSSSANTTTNGNTTTTSTTTCTADSTTNSTNGAAGPLPSVVGMGVTALLFAVTVALVIA